MFIRQLYIRVNRVGKVFFARMISFGLACVVLFAFSISPAYSLSVHGLKYKLESTEKGQEGISQNLSDAKKKLSLIKIQLGTPNESQPNDAQVEETLQQAETARQNADTSTQELIRLVNIAKQRAADLGDKSLKATHANKEEMSQLGVAQDKIKAFNQAIDELSKFANGSVAIEPKKTDPIPAPTPIRAETVTVFEFKNRLESSEKGKEGLIKSLDDAHTKLKEAEPKLSKPTERQPNFALAHEKLQNAQDKLGVADKSKTELIDLLNIAKARAGQQGDTDLKDTYLTPDETNQYNTEQGNIKDAINATTELVDLLDNKSAQQPAPTKPPVKKSNNPPVDSLTVADLKKALESTEPGNEGISTRLQKIKKNLDEAETTLQNFKENKPGYNQAQTELKAARTAFNKADQLTKALNFTISTATYRAQSNHDDTLTRTLAEPDEVTQLRNAQSALTTATNAANGVKKLTDDMTTALVKDTPESFFDYTWMCIPIIAFIVLGAFFDLFFNGGKVYKLIKSMFSSGNTNPPDQDKTKTEEKLSELNQEIYNLSQVFANLKDKLDVANKKINTLEKTIEALNSNQEPNTDNNVITKDTSTEPSFETQKPPEEPETEKPQEVFITLEDSPAIIKLIVEEINTNYDRGTNTKELLELIRDKIRSSFPDKTLGEFKTFDFNFNKITADNQQWHYLLFIFPNPAESQQGLLFLVPGINHSSNVASYFDGGTPAVSIKKLIQPARVSLSNEQIPSKLIEKGVVD